MFNILCRFNRPSKMVEVYGLTADKDRKKKLNVQEKSVKISFQSAKNWQFITFYSKFIIFY